VKAAADYEAEGYQAKTWHLATCPYTKAHIREAWQKGAWRWQEEQRRLRQREADAADGDIVTPSAHGG